PLVRRSGTSARDPGSAPAAAVTRARPGSTAIRHFREKSMNDYLEHHRPSEWLSHLLELPRGYATLVEHSGNLARAAYRLASARCRVHSLPSNLPTCRELGAAATELCQALDRERPCPLALAWECERQGL